MQNVEADVENSGEGMEHRREILDEGHGQGNQIDNQVISSESNSSDSSFEHDLNRPSYF